MTKLTRTIDSVSGQGGAVTPRGSVVRRRKGAILLAALATLPVAAAALPPLVHWKSDERGAPVATDHGFAVSVTVPEVVYKTTPFEIVVVVANLNDVAAEITVSHGDDALDPAILATIWKPGQDHRVSLFPVLQDGWHVMGFISKIRMHAYGIPAGESLSFRAEVDWRNYDGKQCLEPGHPEGIDSGDYRMLLNFAYSLGDNTVPYWSKSKDDPPESNDPPAKQSLPPTHSVTWHLPIEIRDTET